MKNSEILGFNIILLVRIYVEALERKKEFGVPSIEL